MAYFDDETEISLESDRVEVTKMQEPSRDFREVVGERIHDDEGLQGGLRAAGFEIALVLMLRPIEHRDSRRFDSSDDKAELAVPARPDEQVVLLIESPGAVYSWRLPDTRETVPTGRRSMVHRDTVVFRLGENREQDFQGQRRGPVTDWALDKLIAPVRTYVLRYAATATINAGVKRIEGDMVIGPVPIVATTEDGGGAPVFPTPDHWLPRPVIPVPGRPLNRVLLLVHGTFSSTAASFGQLQTSEEGRAFLADAAARYDLILGFDHKTLADTPAENASMILDALAALPLARGSTVDAIAFSRGGLVYRVLAEQLLPASTLDVRLGKAVFVGCTNAGTNLARPANWLALADVYTNVALSTARAAGVLAGGTFTFIAAQVIKTLGRFVQMLPEIAIADRYTPGLAAMEPEGAVVTALNEAVLADSPARYFAITSSFEPTRADGRTMTDELARFLVDRIADRLFASANDLVVNTTSMSDFGVGRDWICDDDLYAFGDTGDVFHTIYFGSAQVAKTLRGWLNAADRTGQTLSPPPRRDPVPGVVARPSAGVEPGCAVDDGAAHDGFLKPQHVSLGSSNRPASDKSSPAHIDWMSGSTPLPEQSETVARHVGAEMQLYPRLSAPANVFVTIAADPLQASGHAAMNATETAVMLDRKTELIVEVVPLANCAIVGQSRQVADPAAAETTLRFLVEGKAPGQAQLLVETRQGAVTVASITLRPEFLNTKEQVLRASQSSGGKKPADPGFVVLRIYEYSELGRVRSLRFVLEGQKFGVGLMQTLELPTSIDLDKHMREVLADAQAAWNLREGETEDALYRTYLSRFVDSAKTRTEALLPKDVRELLWKHRADIAAIQIISENPVIAWELLYMFDPAPAGATDDGEGFLAEWGLTRWLHGVPLPDPTFPLSGERSRFVVPEYAGTSALPWADAERGMLSEQLAGASEVMPTSLAVTDFLKNEASACDVLHFACHGKVNSEGVIKGALSMRGIVRDGKMIPDPLSIDQVRQNVRFGVGPRRALVFVNACQTGQQGYGLTGGSGFADAFLRPRSGQGAAAFIGALWSVDDKLALEFAECFYSELRNGKTLVDAAKAAREVCKTGFDLTWLAYTIYGNPFATVSRVEAGAGQ